MCIRDRYTVLYKNKSQYAVVIVVYWQSRQLYTGLCCNHYDGVIICNERAADLWIYLQQYTDVNTIDVWLRDAWAKIRTHTHEDDLETKSQLFFRKLDQ